MVTPLTHEDPVTDNDEVERLRRQVRAMGVVNQQLRAQLVAATDELAPRRRAEAALRDPDRPPLVGSAPRRGAVAADWLAGLAPVKGAPRPDLVIGPAGDRYLIEAGTRRLIRSGALAAALERGAAPRRDVTDDELAHWPEGPPVEVLETDQGAPFVVVGGLRRPVRGLTLAFPVDPVAAQKLPEGPPLDLSLTTARRDREADAWTAVLATVDTAAPARLVRTPGYGLVVLDGSLRRRVRSRLLVPVLESLLGPTRDVTDEEVDGHGDGPPIELVESRTGPPFLIIGGRRHAVTGFPVPYPITQDAADSLRDGPVVDASECYAQEAADARFARDRAANPDPVAELRSLVATSGGVVGAARALARKGTRKVRR